MENLDEIYDICEKHLKEFPGAIQYVPEKYLTESLCIAAIKGSCRSSWEEKDIWNHIPEKMLTYDVCKAAVGCNRYAIEYIPNEWKTADLFFVAVKCFGDILKYVPRSCQNEEMYLHSVSQNGVNLKYVPQSERTQEICMAAFNAQSNGAKSVEYIPDRFLDEEMCKRAVASEWKTIKVIPNHYRTTDVCLCALQHSKWVDMDEKNPDKSFLQFVNDYIPDDISKNVCREFYEYVVNVKREKHERQEWLHKVSENPVYIKNIPIEKRDVQICEAAVNQEGMMLKYVPEKFRTRAFCDMAVRNNADAIMYVPDDIKEDVINSVKSSYQYVRILFSDSKFKKCFINKKGE